MDSIGSKFLTRVGSQNQIDLESRLKLTVNVRFTQRLSSKISVRISRYGIENELIRTAQNNSYG